MRVLLLQFRNANDIMLLQELECFRRRAALGEHEIHSRNLITRRFHLSDTDGFDAVFMGGSGEYSLSSHRPRDIEHLLAEIPALVESGMPIFASCFGFHLMVEAYGGKIDQMNGEVELGTYLLELSADAANDPVFSKMPEQFWVQLGHHDWVVELPDTEFTVLAGNSSSPYQALRFGKNPVYASQFHPELTGEENKARYLRYVGNYGDDGTIDPEILARFRPSFESNKILQVFLDEHVR